MTDKTAPSPLPPLPTYEIALAPRPPVLDGTLSDPLWDVVPAMRLRECVGGGPAAQATLVRLMWHGDYLYLGAWIDEFDLEDHNQKRNDPVYGEQCVELFLAAPGGVPAEDGGVWRYLEMDTSPTGIFWDGRMENHRPAMPDPAVKYPLTMDETYAPPDLLTRTSLDGTLNDRSVRDRGWKLEVQVPLTGPPGGAPPQIGDVWRGNVYRIHNWQQPDQELQAWSPTGLPNFHVPQRFGYLRFGGPV